MLYYKNEIYNKNLWNSLLWIISRKWLINLYKVVLKKYIENLLFLAQQNGPHET